MDGWLVWVLPIGLFWPIAALYLGGMFEVKGASPLRELIGLALSFVLALAVWWGLTKALAPIGPVMGAIVFPTGLMLAALPVILLIGYRLAALRLVRSTAH
ncbi:MAG TPA: hypothetical protein VFO95_16495 [Gemmatimonadales bacterium]|nr:hypothetical protein [Gemmatimonadales bacterium]